MLTYTCNPRNFDYPDCPVMVFSDKADDLVAFIIKMRTKGVRNHFMWIHRPGFFASQNLFYVEVPMGEYMEKTCRLKFVEVIGLNQEQKDFLIDCITKKLSLPWYKRGYDFLGIIGQAIGIKALNNPWKDFCVEDGPRFLKKMAKALMPADDFRYSVIMNINNHAHPQELSEYFKAHPTVFRTIGKWEQEDES